MNVVSFQIESPVQPREGGSRRAAVSALATTGPPFVCASEQVGAGSDHVRACCAESIIPCGIEAYAHVTTRGRTRGELDAMVNSLAATGVTGIVALYGHGTLATSPASGPFPLDLIEIVRTRAPSLRVAVGIDIHRVEDPALLDLVAAKASAADIAFTQMLFGVAPYLWLIDELAKRAVTTPIVPGVFVPESTEASWIRMRRAGTPVPRSFAVARAQGRTAFDDVVRTHMKRLVDDLGRVAPALHVFVSDAPERSLAVLPTFVSAPHRAGLGGYEHA